MKTLIALTLACTLQAHASDYVNFIRQIQNDAEKTTITASDLPNEGSRDADEKVTGSSVFELWAINKTTFDEFLLDVKTVSSYHPEAEISITSADPYTLNPRTLEGYPYDVIYTMKGLVTDDDSVQLAAQSALLVRLDKNGDVIEEKSITKNETKVEAYLHDPKSVKKKETVVIYAHPDGGFTEHTELATQSVEIFKKAFGSFTGIDETETYVDPPSIEVKVNRMYPDSFDNSSYYYLEITSSNWDAPKTLSSATVVNTKNRAWSPRKRTVSNLSELITENGTYTIDLRIHNHFEDRSLDKQQLKIQKGIDINANINSAE